MKEGTKALLISFIFLIIGILLYLYVNPSISPQVDFNFNKVELTINGEQVIEKLYFDTNKEYHTLYRNFESELKDQKIPQSNTIFIKEVDCVAGTPYYRTNWGCHNNNPLEPGDCLPYTELNEYGCTFGNVYGFERNTNYWISSLYYLQQENLIKIKENYYIKFVAYAKNNHYELIRDKSLTINDNAITKKKYSPKEKVIIYLPYEGDKEGYNIITQKRFKFDSSGILDKAGVLFWLIPGLAFFLVWFCFGKEHKEGDIPKELSMYPNKRKAWQVAAFFNPPFGKSKEIFPTFLAELYDKKTIDIKIINKKAYFKINESNLKGLDAIENKFISFLRKIEKLGKEKEGYFELDSSKLDLSKRISLSKNYQSLSSKIKKDEKEYFEKNKATSIFTLIVMLSLFIIQPLYAMIGPSLTPTMIIFSISSVIIFSIISYRSTLMSKYKKEYYLEYQKWNSFKNFLENSDSMKLHGHKGTIIWGRFLVYATALGVAKKVLKELKNENLITKEQYGAYNTINSPTILSMSLTTMGSNRISTSHGSSSFGGGSFGGSGGGGIGGGGGGGR